MPILNTPARCAAGLLVLLVLSVQAAHPGHAGSLQAAPSRRSDLGAGLFTNVSDQRAIYSYPVNTYPDGWAALKAEPWGGSQRLTKVYDGTLFLVIGQVPGWKLVRFKSGERGWIAERLVGCCRPASH